MVETAKANWNTMDEAERLTALRAITAKHDAFFGFKNTRLIVEYVPPVETYIKACDKTVMSGFGAKFAMDTNTITMNSYEKQINWSNFEMALSTAIHENTHAHQWQLATQLGHGGIERDDPRWAQAALFLANFTGVSNSIFTSGRNNINTGAYYAQPTERHTYWTQKQLLKVRSDVQKHITAAINNKLGRQLKTPETDTSKSVPRANPYCD